MSDMSRKEAIEYLKTLKAFLDINGVFTVSDAMKKSIDFAIASLETDEAYQLMEEQPEVCANCIDREAALKLFYDYKEQHSEDKKKYPMNYGTLCDMIRWIRELPSVLPKADKPTIIDWNNCHTPEQLESISTTKNDLAQERYQDLMEYFNDKEVAKTILEDRKEFKAWLERLRWNVKRADELARELEQIKSTTKNDLGVDCISRQKVLDLINADWKYENLEIEINNLPPVTQQEPFINKPCVSIGVCDEDKVKVLDKIRAEIMDTGAYEQEVDGKTEFLNGINYCLSVIDKYKAESEESSGIEKCKPCINYEDGCEEWSGCPCVYYKAEIEPQESEE